MGSRHLGAHGTVAAALVALIVPVSPVSAGGPPVGTFYFHGDHLGSVTAVSNSAGEITGRISYSPNGKVRVVPGDGEASGKARFTGKQWEAATDLFYFGARWYDADHGRFLSPDGQRQTSTPYGYAGAAPLEYVDTDGNRFTRFSAVLREAAADHGIVLDNPASRLQAAYIARTYAIESRRYYEKMAGIHRDRARRIKHDMAQARPRATAARKQVMQTHRRVAYIAKLARHELGETAQRYYNPYVFTSRVRAARKRFKHEAMNVLARGDALPDKWKVINSRLKQLEKASDKGWYVSSGPHGEGPERVVHKRHLTTKAISDARALLSSVLGNYANEEYVLNHLARVPREVHILSDLYYEREALPALKQRALRNAARIDNVVMPDLDVYINTQRQSLGLPLDQPW